MSVPPRHIRWASYLRRKNEQQLAARQHDLRFMMEDNARMEARRNGHAPIPATNGASSPPPPRQPASGDVFGRDRQKRAPAPPPTTFEFLSIDQLNELPDMKWIFDGLWPQRGIGIFYGKAGTGKTFIMTDFACKVAHNIGPVLFLSIDDGTSIKTPIAAWHEHHQPKKQLNMTIISQQIDFTNPTTMASFKRAIDEHFDRPFALILIDGLADVMGQGSLNDLNDVEAVFKGAQMIQEEGLILFIHHERKDGQSFNGSQRLMDKASVFVKAKAQDDDSIMMEWLKVKGSNRKGHKEFVRLKQVGGSAVAVKAARPSDEGRRLERIEPMPVNAQTILAKMEADDDSDRRWKRNDFVSECELSEQQARRGLEWLVKNDRIRKEGNGSSTVYCLRDAAVPF